MTKKIGTLSMISRQQKSKKKGVGISVVLRSAGLKVTPIRVAILEFLTKSHGPFTIQQIFQGLKSNKSLKSLDLVTVYRNMEKFVSAKLVTECLFADGTPRFEIEDSNKHHHHLVCTSCKRIDPIFYCPVKISIPDEMTKGYSNLTHTLEFYGICRKCQRS